MIAGLGGCAGGGRVDIVPMNLRAISLTNRLVQSQPVDRSYFWEGDQGRVYVTMEWENFSLIGDYGKRSMALSLVLEGMPAGSSRNYKVTKRTLRMIARAGANHARWASLLGIVAVWRDGDDKLRGRFRIMSKQQDFFVTLGWSGNRRALLISEFTAVRNPTAGLPTLEQTEADGMERNPVTKPAVSPQPLTDGADHTN